MMENYKIDRYVSELGNDFLRNKNKVLLEAPTNSGKTHYVINYCKDNYESFVYYADTILLAEQMAKEHGLELHTANNPAPYGSLRISTVYNHYPIFSSEGYNTTIEDECHTSIADYGFKSEVIDNVITFSEYNDTRYLLSGTVLDIPEGFDHMKIDRKQPSDFKIQVITDFITSGQNFRTDLLVSEIMQGINNGKQVWISTFDKSNELPLYIKILEKNGVSKDEIEQINADTKNGKAYNNLVNNRKIESCKVVFTTFVQGFNIDGNSGQYKLIILPNLINKHSWADIVQIYNRFRDNNGELEAKIIWDSFPENHKENVDEIFKQEWERIFNIYKEERFILEKYLEFSRSIIGHFDTRLSRWFIDQERLGLINTDLNINTTKLKYNVHQKITEIMWTDFEIMKELMTRGGITLEEVASSFKAYKLLDADEKNQLKPKPHEDKVRLNSEALKDVMCLEELPIGSPYFSYIKDLFDITGDFNYSKKCIIECYGNRKKLNDLQDDIRLRYASDPISKAFRKHVYDGFKIGAGYINSQILSVFQDISNQTDGNNHIDSTYKAVRTLRKFFEVETSNEGSGKNTIRYYKIVQRK